MEVPKQQGEEIVGGGERKSFIAALAIFREPYERT